MKELKPSISYNVIITIRIIKYSKFFTVCAYRKVGPVNKFEEEKESNKKKRPCDAWSHDPTTNIYTIHNNIKNNKKYENK